MIHRAILNLSYLKELNVSKFDVYGNDVIIVSRHSIVHREIYGFKYDKFHDMNQFLFFQPTSFRNNQPFSFDNLQFFIRCGIALMAVFKRKMFLP